MKLFGGTFKTLESFRYTLKSGAPESILATVGFMMVSSVIVIAITLLSAAVFDDINTARNIGAVALYTAIFTLVYNIIKAAFECFLEEREEFFEKLKR
jgi:hypothetical protein